MWFAVPGDREHADHIKMQLYLFYDYATSQQLSLELGLKGTGVKLLLGLMNLSLGKNEAYYTTIIISSLSVRH